MADDREHPQSDRQGRARKSRKPGPSDVDPRQGQRSDQESGQPVQLNEQDAPALDEQDRQTARAHRSGPRSP